jgi:DNA-binding NtrC family response regulator
MESRIGLFEQAQGGTLFLDEVGNLTAETQTKLLQFLQDFTITRIGGTRPIPLDIRLIAASNTDLSGMVGKGLFREDLYYRIAVVPIHLPPLRHRLEDLPELCQGFVDAFSRANHKDITGIMAEGYKKLYAHSWPGNVRELKNVIERAVIFCAGREIGAADLDLSPARGTGAPFQAAGRKKKAPVELSREEAINLLARHKGVVREAAREIGVSRRAIYYCFKKLGIRPNDLRQNPHRRGR